MFSVLFFFTVAVGLLTRDAMIYGLGHEVEAERARLERLHAEHQRLLVEAAALESLDRVEREARREGYVEPSSLRMVRADAPAPGALAGRGNAEPPRSAVVALTPGGSGAGAGAGGEGAATPAGGSWWDGLLAAVRHLWNRWAVTVSHVAGR
ncbi:MAG TPA: hypothetical protein VIK92_04030 [Thermaerobacter sp.]